MSDVLDFVRRDPELQLRMYAAYSGYMSHKDVAPEDIMSFDEWRAHFNLIVED